MPAKKYDWDKWFSEAPLYLKRHQDYECSQSSMYQQILSAASARGIRVTVTDEGVGFFVTIKQLVAVET